MKYWSRSFGIFDLIISDDEYHIAGDGKLAGVIESNPAKCYTDDNEYRIYDYPSISQINHVAKLNKVNIIFAIVKKPNSPVEMSYSKLSKRIANSNFGILDEHDDNNVINLVLENYKVSYILFHYVRNMYDKVGSPGVKYIWVIYVLVSFIMN